MLKLVESLDHARYSPRMYVVANTDAMSGRKAEAYEQALLAQVHAHPLFCHTHMHYA